ncbi:fluoride efflux transporter CrcB [Pricia sp. S334]|uniref:Fluoride-specific ion channel FluC n=1 Tax=Pricia mediterranea TaxID=3076079 RepID=A0ABU3L8M3_9FLAO|nr:fluoride efflux transporter CrcB [Pricia sp. S334]MDT7829723.1 fluoride efflux transporter CrcB [Pricia sp. S334]
MKQWLLVFLGGGIGSVLRHLIARHFNTYFSHFFLGTFIVNVLGSLLIGLILGFSVKGQYLSENQTLLLAAGFCGGFTTFSTFAFEKHALLTAGELFHFSFYLIASIVVGIAAVAGGLWLAKLF